MKFTLRHLVYIAVFGTLWGVLEMTSGAYLHVLFPPGASYLPLVGPAMAALGLAIALVGRHFVPRSGSVLMIGVVAALLKLLSLGGIKLGPFLGILIESGLAEVVLLAAGRLRSAPAGAEGRFGFAMAGAIGVASTIPQRFLLAGLILGKSLGDTYQGLIKEGSTVLGLSAGYALAIVIFLVLVDLAMGGIAGALAWEASLAAETRLARY
jgi:hypothetical protein